MRAEWRASRRTKLWLALFSFVDLVIPAGLALIVIPPPFNVLAFAAVVGSTGYRIATVKCLFLGDRVHVRNRYYSRTVAVGDLRQPSAAGLGWGAGPFVVAATAPARFGWRRIAVDATASWDADEINGRMDDWERRIATRTSS